jgi:hypothetical protein
MFGIPMALLGLVTTLCIVGGGIFGFASEAGATATLTVTPNTGLAGGQIVVVSGSGLAEKSLGTILECNTDPSQPTVMTNLDPGKLIPVSCSPLLTYIATTSSTGTMGPTNFTVLQGTVGPPVSGPDSAGNAGSVDAPKYPCPPTQAQINAGDVCTIAFGDQGGDEVLQTITFAGQPLPQPAVTSVLPNSGPVSGGSAVTISGANLSSPTAVTFGGVAATSFASVSATSVTAVSPPSTKGQTVDVEVTTAGGTSAVAPPGDQFTYTLGPVITGISPNGGPPAGGTVVTISGEQLSGSTSVDFGSTPATTFTVNSATSITATSPAGTGVVHVVVTSPTGVSSNSAENEFSYKAGYWLAASDGGVFSYGDAPFYGSAGNIVLNKPVVGMAATADGHGYWLVASDGGVFSYGDAKFYGSTGGVTLNQPIVGMAATADGKGYWLVAADGGVFSYGDATFYGSTGSTALNKPIVGMASTADGKGYWLVASDGGVFAYGDAAYQGSTGSIHLNAPVVGMAADPNGGYWLVGSDGGIFSFGGATFQGSTGSLKLNAAVVGMAAAPSGGYWLVASDGGVFSFGTAAFYGSAGETPLNKPVVGMVAAG